MKIKILVFAFFISMAGYSQIDYSIFLKKKISKSDLKKFSNSHKKFKKINSSECIYGDCKSTKSVKKIKFLVNKWIDGSGSNHTFYHYFYIVGNFTNGKLNGRAYIYHYSENYHANVEKLLVNKSNIDLILEEDDRKTPSINYLEYITAIFKDNIAKNGTYSINYDLTKYATPLEYTILTPISFLRKLPLMNDFFNNEINVNTKTKNIRYFFDGNLKDLKLSNTGKRFSRNFNKIVMKFMESENFYIQYKIKPIIGDEKLNLEDKIPTYKSSTKTFEDVVGSTELVFKNNSCENCDITEISSYASTLKQSIYERKQRELEEKVSRAKSLVGHFATRFGIYFYINSYDTKGCVYGNRYPTKAYWEKDYVSFYNDCSPENFEIANVSVCPNCKGWGTEDVKVTYNTTYYTTDNAGNKTYDKSPSRSGTVTEKHTCHVCGGKGVITNKN